MSLSSPTIRKILVSGALAAGASLGAAGIASAASSASSSSTSSGGSASTGTSVTAPSGSSAPSGSTAPSGAPDPSTMSHGPGETLLTGTDLQKAEAAANSAVSGATVIRAETDSSGVGTYEVHLKKSDGTVVTVELNSNFGVVKTISGFGAGPAGQAPPSGAPGGPNGAAPSSSTAA